MYKYFPNLLLTTYYLLLTFNKNTKLNVQHYKNIILPLLCEAFDEREAENLFKYALEDYFKKRFFDIKNYDLSDDEIEELNYIYGKISDHYPIQYLFNKTEFYGIDFYVDENVLIPRAETEELIHWILTDHVDTHSCINLLDIGTGSGCIPIILKKNKPTWNIAAIDISENALEVARTNALKHHTEIEFIEGDILNARCSMLNSIFDIIVSNPPYIPTKEKALMSTSTIQHEPHLALFVQDEHPIIFYEKIADFAKNHLVENGKLYFELNEFNADDVREMLVNKGFQNIIIKKDFAGKDRMLRANL
jgi:release factor glutamine methyltransferase